MWIGGHLAHRTRCPIHDGDFPAIGRGPKYVGIGWAYGHVGALAASGFVPVFGITQSTQIAGRNADGTVVLLARIQAVRELLVHCDAVKLGSRLVVLIGPGFAPIEADCSSTIVAIDHDVGVIRVEPDAVAIAVGYPDFVESFAAINGFQQIDIVDVHCIFIFRVGGDVAIIPASLLQIVIT